MRRRTYLAVGIALGATVMATANARERLPRECRREIVKLCGFDRSQMPSCLKEKQSQLSSSCRATLKERILSRQEESQQAAGRPDRTISYGSDRRQSVDFYAAKSNAGAPPLVLFIHGGGWVVGNKVQSLYAKPAHFTDTGYAFASAGYRLLPDSPVEEQAADIGRAITSLRKQARQLGFDPARIVLMGHSAGAHLAALVSTDPKYAGASFNAIKGVVLLDGAGYNVPANMAGGRSEVPMLYRNAFGTEPKRQAELSPITHVGGKDAPDWLILYVADRKSSLEQSQELAQALRKAGANARSIAVPDSTHASLNKDLGKSGDFATGKVDAWLERLFGT